TAAQLGDRLLYEIALDHCLTTRRFLVRGDGSTAHEGIFSTETGEFLHQSTHQGWRGDSCWARGQAWALFGFSTTYAYTNDSRFLDTARTCADYFIENTPDHGVPPNDWDEAKHMVNKGGTAYESSAAAIAVCGFLQIADQIENQGVACRYRERAWRTLSTLLSSEFLAERTPGWEGILKHGIYHKRKDIGVDESVMWGDYFLLYALDRLTRFRFSN
ncbi:MAG: glycoside hydrolase family 88 protein, partial [Verrucomicrobia bacterium]|nr:glycoside hydrolase family 88 protein [Verrucomicrobiota bacterium]